MKKRKYEKILKIKRRNEIKEKNEVTGDERKK